MILDGFPRTKGQLEKYDKLFPIHVVLNITLKDDILLEKLMGRRTCKKCGQAFNICNIQRFIECNLEMDIQWTHYYPRKKVFVTPVEINSLLEMMIHKELLVKE